MYLGYIGGKCAALPEDYWGVYMECCDLHRLYAPLEAMHVVAEGLNTMRKAESQASVVRRRATSTSNSCPGRLPRTISISQGAPRGMTTSTT